MELLPPVGWADVARQSDLVAIRGEIAELRGEIKAQLPRLYIANVAAMVGISGLVLAAAKFA
jgi:hypothetical protein